MSATPITVAELQDFDKRLKASTPLDGDPVPTIIPARDGKPVGPRDVSKESFARIDGRMRMMAEALIVANRMSASLSLLLDALMPLAAAMKAHHDVEPDQEFEITLTAAHAKAIEKACKHLWPEQYEKSAAAEVGGT